MKELLIIFVVLLVLLMLISTFGGSIRQKESFVQVTEEEFRAKKPLVKTPPAFELPNLPAPNLTPLPSNPPFDIPAPPITDLKKMNIEPFQNNSLTQYAQL